MQGREQGARLNLESVLCDLRNAIGNAEPVQRPQAERLEHQKIQRALQKIVLRLLHSISYRQSIPDRYQCSYRMSIGATDHADFVHGSIRINLFLKSVLSVVVLFLPRRGYN